MSVQHLIIADFTNEEGYDSLFEIIVALDKRFEQGAPSLVDSEIGVLRKIHYSAIL